ncbi:hypothetical protein ACFVGB_004770, partial [Salmonella enterica]
YTGVALTSNGPGGTLVFYGELASHFPTSPLGGKYGSDIFHTAEAQAFCGNATGADPRYYRSLFSEALRSGPTVGGAANVSGIKSLYIGRAAGAFNTGGDTNPELFVSGGGPGSAVVTPTIGGSHEVDPDGHKGAAIPRMLMVVNGKRTAATAWTLADDGADTQYDTARNKYYISIGHRLAEVTQWDLSDMYFVNNWPGTPLTQHKADRNDTTNKFVTQVNYVSGYVCNASLQ